MTNLMNVEIHMLFADKATINIQFVLVSLTFRLKLKFFFFTSFLNIWHWFEIGIGIIRFFSTNQEKEWNQ